MNLRVRKTRTSSGNATYSFYVKTKTFTKGFVKTLDSVVFEAAPSINDFDKEEILKEFKNGVFNEQSST